MDRKPIPYIPSESLKTQRVEVYINDLQTRLHQLRNKHDTIFIECCDILKKIQEVSTQTITKQQEIGRIINEFEELGLKNTVKDSVLKKALIKKVGDVKRLREKFEKIFQENLNELIVRTKGSLEDVDKFHLDADGGNSPKSRGSNDQRGFADDDRDSGLWSTIESFYSLTTEPADVPETMCLEKDEVAKALD